MSTRCGRKIGLWKPNLRHGTVRELLVQLLHTDADRHGLGLLRPDQFRAPAVTRLTDAEVAAQAVIDAGLIWIGPSPQSIRELC